VKRTPLKGNLDRLREFNQRGRASSARSLDRTRLPTKPLVLKGPKASRKVPRRHSFTPASDAQRRKVLGLPCLGCGREGTAWLAIDPAHVTPRSLGGCDAPECVVPLCRDGAGQGCHRAYDQGRLDLLPLLENQGAWRAEQAHAVEHLGLAAAFRRITNDRKVVARS
jgi:hypothetical protein